MRLKRANFVCHTALLQPTRDYIVEVSRKQFFPWPSCRAYESGTKIATHDRLNLSSYESDASFFLLHNRL